MTGINELIKKKGLPQVLKSIFPHLRGINFSDVKFLPDFETILDEKFKSFEWYFSISSEPEILRVATKDDLSKWFKELLIRNDLEIKLTEEFYSIDPNDFWLGDGFKINIIKRSEVFFIIRIIYSKSSSDKKGTFLNPTNSVKIKTPEWIRGFEFVIDAYSISSDERDLNKNNLSPIYFTAPSESIIIPVNNRKTGEAVIDKIIYNNGGHNSFSSLERENWHYLYQGYLFIIGYVEGKGYVKINRNIKEKGAQKGIHQLSEEINKCVNGLNKQILNVGEYEVNDGRMIAQDNNARHSISKYKNAFSAIDNFKGIVIEYNSDDPFLSITNESIHMWLDKKAEKKISFNVPQNFEIILHKQGASFNLELTLSNPKTDINTPSIELENDSEKPLVKFEESIKTRGIKPQVSSTTIQDVQNNKENLSEKRKKLLESSVVKSESSNDLISKSSKQNFKYWNWIFGILGVVLLFIMIKNCTGDRSPSYYHEKANDYANSKKYDKASDYYEKALEADNSFIDSYLARAEMYLKVGEYQKAIYDLNEALIIDSSNWYAYYLRGLANMGLGETSKYSRLNENAIDDFSKSLNLNSTSDNGKSYYFRGKVYQFIEDESFCLDYYRACEWDILDSCELADEFCIPETGFMPYNRNFGPGIFTGRNEFEFDNTSGEKDMVFSLVNKRTNLRVRSQYVRKGEKIIVENIPDGAYIIQFYKGNYWSNTITLSDGITKGGFLTDVEFERISKTYYLNPNSLVSGIIMNAVNGTIDSESINESDFFN